MKKELTHLKHICLSSEHSMVSSLLRTIKEYPSAFIFG